jgi:hypothetical protein
MKYSRHQLNKVGSVLSADPAPVDMLKTAEATLIVDDWRKTHLSVLEDLYKQIGSILYNARIYAEFSSQRLKRMTSIITKLKRNKDMGLGGMQDIGGARYVFTDAQILKKAQDCLSQNIPSGFTLEHDIYDYVSSPKTSGYRSIHFVYKYHSEDTALDGLKIELQIRTLLQHAWATAVETAELISRSPLKSGIGDEDWLEFFQLTSAIFARKENLPVAKAYEQFSQRDFCRIYNEKNEAHKFLDKLQALIKTVKTTEEKPFNLGYIVLYINYIRKTVSMRHFPTEEREQANILYSQTERQITPGEGAVVLVSTEDITKLKEAYPSYFLNATKFVFALQDFSEECKQIDTLQD